MPQTIDAFVLKKYSKHKIPVFIKIVNIIKIFMQYTAALSLTLMHIEILQHSTIPIINLTQFKNKNIIYVNNLQFNR